MRSIALLLSLLAVASDATASGTPRRWTPPALASDQYESSPTFAPGGRELYFMRADRNFGHYRILRSQCTPAGWSAPAEASFAAPRSALEGDPFVTADGKTLYFVSSRQDPKHEDLDIWSVVRKDPDSAWSQPQRLPEPVNSPHAELLPRLAADGRLYFGSSRPGGHGQGDIYVATPTAGGGWRVENVGPPVSTAANEYEAEISRDGLSLVVVADRGDRSHLYRYVRSDGRWVERGRIPADDTVFQVGPLLSPDSQRLLFAQRDGKRSGEWFLTDLAADTDHRWPPQCIRESQ